MKSRSIFIIKTIVSIILVVFLGTLGLDAADHRGNLSESMLGKFISGDDSGNICPAGMVLVDNGERGFCIDRYEVSPGGKCLYNEPKNKMESQANIDMPGCMPVSEAGSVPWIKITQNQAVRACAKAGKRLPSNSEWQAAVMGTPDKGSSWGAEDCHVNGNWPESPGRSGSGEKCASYVGAFDMIGNVWEWVTETVADGRREGIELPESGYVGEINEDAIPTISTTSPTDIYYGDRLWIKKEGTRGVARGGYWNNGADAGEYSFYIVTPPSEAGSGIGFRCVKSLNK